MNHLTLISTFLLLILAGTCTGAEATKVYKTTDADGRPIFTDQATEGAEVIEVKETTTFPGAAFAEEYGELMPARPEAKGTFQYRSLSILSPMSDESIRDNAGNLTIAIQVDPTLASNHELQVVMDGQVVQQVNSSAPISLAEVDRGTHQVHLRVVEKGTTNIIQEGEPVSFTLLRHSILNRAR